MTPAYPKPPSLFTTRRDMPDYKDSDSELIRSFPLLLLSLSLLTSMGSVGGCPYAVEKLAPAPAEVLKVTVTTRGLLAPRGPVAAIVRRQLRGPVADTTETAPVVPKARDPRINLDFLRLYALDRRARDNLLLVETGKVSRYVLRFHYQHNVHNLSQRLLDKLWERVTLPPRRDPCPPRGKGQLPRAQSMRKGAVPARWVAVRC